MVEETEAAGEGGSSKRRGEKEEVDTDGTRGGRRRLSRQGQSHRGRVLQARAPRGAAASPARGAGDPTDRPRHVDRRRSTQLERCGTCRASGRSCSQDRGGVKRRGTANAWVRFGCS